MPGGSDNPGNFSSSSANVTAVVATGTQGAQGVGASSDTGIGVWGEVVLVLACMARVQPGTVYQAGTSNLLAARSIGQHCLITTISVQPTILANYFVAPSIRRMIHGRTRCRNSI